MSTNVDQILTSVSPILAAHKDFRTTSLTDDNQDHHTGGFLVRVQVGEPNQSQYEPQTAGLRFSLFPAGERLDPVSSVDLDLVDQGPDDRVFWPWRTMLELVILAG
jgi:hypothetical protein